MQNVTIVNTWNITKNYNKHNKKLTNKEDPKNKKHLFDNLDIWNYKSCIIETMKREKYVTLHGNVL